ncbi:MAG: hypothetical protein KatS3mg131_0540 [Candidatus Tectimicrobiota bacterium]|nr:MAG: hypothetical protein KatS3mg131_0540 [Candidatus Tectomicrobia bacterium]
MVKAGVIADAELFAFLEAHAAEVRQRQEAALRFCIERAVAVKVNVVQQDPTERGVRAILNFGHTIGHALEAATAYTRYTHGEAVAIGMALVAHLSVELGYCRSETRDRLLRLLQALELPVTGIEVAPSRLLELMSRDKKALHGIVRFVLLKDIGAVCYHQEVPAAVLHALLQQHASPSGG